MVARRKLSEISLNRIFNALSIGVQYSLSFQWTNFEKPGKFSKFQTAPLLLNLLGRLEAIRGQWKLKALILSLLSLKSIKIQYTSYHSIQSFLPTIDLLEYKFLNDISAMDNNKWIRQFKKSKNIKSKAFLWVFTSSRLCYK